jgi:pseudaminic acid biosynthesis-associated methylase
MTEQIDFWKSKFGDNYTRRNSGDFDLQYKEKYGVTRTKINKDFLGKLNKNSRMLEVGCNKGMQLEILKKMGFKNLAGVEVNDSAVHSARKDRDLCIFNGSAFDLPFNNNYFDLVFTSGVLIHIAPKDLHKAIKEIIRVSKKYVFGFEYFSDKCQEIEYRGNKNKLWKNNFPQLFLDTDPSLKMVKLKKYKYLNGEDNIDVAYLLEKKIKK